MRDAVWTFLFSLLAAVALAQPRHGRLGSPDRSGSPEENEVRQAAESMHAFWNRGDARNYSTALSDDTDWENAAGWRIRGRAAVAQFLGEYLWAQGSRPVYRSSGERVRILGAELAVVESEAEASSTVEPGGAPRRVREMQFFQKRGGRWQVISTRMWEPRPGPQPPRLQGLSPVPFDR
jgi:uncharacterized protein (TIGR02246 family)